MLATSLIRKCWGVVIVRGHLHELYEAMDIVCYELEIYCQCSVQDNDGDAGPTRR